MLSPHDMSRNRPSRLAVLGQVGEAGVERVLGASIASGLPSSRTSPPALRVGAVDQARELGAAGADQAGDPEHLALVELEAARASRACRRR